MFGNSVGRKAYNFRKIISNLKKCTPFLKFIHLVTCLATVHLLFSYAERWLFKSKVLGSPPGMVTSLLSWKNVNSYDIFFNNQ